MKNIYYIVLIPLVFVAGMLLYFGFEIYRSIALVNVSLLLSLFWFYSFGTFRYSRTKPMLILVFNMVFGGLSQMAQALPQTIWLTLIPAFVFLFIYFLHYFRKPIKKTLDRFILAVIILIILSNCNPFVEELWWLAEWFNFGYLSCVLICLMLMIAEMKEWPNWVYVSKPLLLNLFVSVGYRRPTKMKNRQPSRIPHHLLKMKHFHEIPYTCFIL
ncbi:MAG TPA: hypothetical protein DCF44_03715 [Chitinophagaceae bacterium]|nr:hypothetical protein [Chitinophagaceae bacterium]